MTQQLKNLTDQQSTNGASAPNFIRHPMWQAFVHKIGQNHNLVVKACTHHDNFGEQSWHTIEITPAPYRPANT